MSRPLGGWQHYVVKGEATPRRRWVDDIHRATRKITYSNGPVVDVPGKPRSGDRYIDGRLDPLSHLTRAERPSIKGFRDWQGNPPPPLDEASPGTGGTGTGTGGTGTGTGGTDLAAMFSQLLGVLGQPRQPAPAPVINVKTGPTEAELRAERVRAAQKAEDRRRSALAAALSARGSRATMRVGLGGFNLGGTAATLGNVQQ